MSNEMQIFSNPQFGEIRRVTIDGEHWLVAYDVARALGYQNGSRDVNRHVDDEDRRITEVTGVYGDERQMIVINESGVYSLIFSSKLPDAKKFKKWVTSEILPSIRKTGSYSVQPPQPMTQAQLIAAQAQLMVDMEQKMLAIQNQTDAIQNQQNELSQKVDTAIKAFSRPSEDHWKTDTDQAIKNLCEEQGLNLPKTRGRMYLELEQKCGCDINNRLTRLRKRKKKQGARYQDVQALTKLDAIAVDKQLRAVFESIVREWQVRSIHIEGQESIREVRETFEQCTL